MNRVFRLLVLVGVSLSALHFVPPAASAVTIDWAYVGDPGNAADPLTGRGAVSYSYFISKYDVTNGQYVEFLNAKDLAGANSLALYNTKMGGSTGGIAFNALAADGNKYSAKAGREEFPVNFVSWFDAVRFANWLNNGQGSGDTESGSYNLLGGRTTPLNPDGISRTAAGVILIPSDDEWYKAAHYDPVSSTYFLYPTGSELAPNPVQPTTASNAANFNRAVGGLTKVGAYSTTTSPYGAFDMGGNVFNWTETLEVPGFRRMQGSAWISGLDDLKSTFESIDPYGAEVDFEGFRVAMFVPEPSTSVMATIACGLLCVLRKRFKKALLPLVVVGAFLGALLTAPLSASAVTIDWVHVGDAGNSADPLTGFGAVNHSYQIGKYDVTNSQYVEFLNVNDPAGKNALQLYNSSMQYESSGGIRYQPFAVDGHHFELLAGLGQHPVTNVSWYDAIRFINWLNNGQIPGATETGAYDLTGLGLGADAGANIARNPSAKVFLPSEDEWYKAAYYNPETGNYYLYPSGSDTPPTASVPSSNANSANYKNAVGHLTDVGAYTGTTSPYGAFDMAGEVYQWNEAKERIGHPETWRGFRGAGYDGHFTSEMISTRRQFDEPGDSTPVIGFRVAAVPEPSTGGWATIACGLLGLLRKRFKKPS